jgi:hypothetical protein
MLNLEEDNGLDHLNVMLSAMNALHVKVLREPCVAASGAVRAALSVNDFAICGTPDGRRCTRQANICGLGPSRSLPCLPSAAGSTRVTFPVNSLNRSDFRRIRPHGFGAVMGSSLIPVRI